VKEKVHKGKGGKGFYAKEQREWKSVVQHFGAGLGKS